MHRGTAVPVYENSLGKIATCFLLGVYCVCSFHHTDTARLLIDWVPRTWKCISDVGRLVCCPSAPLWWFKKVLHVACSLFDLWRYPLSENPLILKGQMGKPGFWASFGKIRVFQWKNPVFHLHPLFWHFSQAKCRMFEEQSKGAGSRAGVERSRQVSFTAKLYIGFLDVFWESLVVSFCTAKCAIASCSSRLELKRQG